MTPISIFIAVMSMVAFAAECFRDGLTMAGMGFVYLAIAGLSNFVRALTLKVEE